MNLNNNIKWTKEVPTEEGLYWIKDESGASIVNIQYDNYLRRLVAYEVGWDCRVELSSFNDFEWYGPLSPPK